MKKLVHSVLLMILLTLLTFNNVYAQGYSFSVEKEAVHVYWNKDGTMSLDYTWDFVNQPGAHPIDFVDVGIPNANFDITTAQANVNGNPVTISKSDYQGSGSGFAVVMGLQAIPAGGKGEVHVYVERISNVLYTDDNDQNYASAVFAPTYFGSKYVTGITDLTVTFHLPPGIKPEEPRWHDNTPAGFPSQPQTGVDSQGLIIYTWQTIGANAYTPYTFGASFPQKYVPASAIAQPSFLSRLGITMDNENGFFFILSVALLIFVSSVMFVIGTSRRKMVYLTPSISIEGHGIGIKRGLTAVEAALLMGEPLDKVLTMILFGLVKKGAAQVVSRDPIKLDIKDPLPENLYHLYPYENDFLAAFAADKDSAHRSVDLENMFIGLVRSLSEKMKMFSRQETIAYYKDIIEKAWQQVDAANTPEVIGQQLEENIEWTMLDKSYEDRARRVFTGPINVPSWWGHYDPDWKHAVSSTSSHLSQGENSSPSLTLPGADFAASIVNNVQNFSRNVIGNIDNFTGLVSGVTNPLIPPVSIDIPSISSDSGSSDGGGEQHHSSSSSHSCACACACAGCACACAGSGR